MSEKHNLGEAGEILIMSDLRSKGFQTSPASQHATCDVILHMNKRSIGIQVKTTAAPKIIKGGHAYTWHYPGVNNWSGGKMYKSRRYDHDDFEIIACVAWDIKAIFYKVLGKEYSFSVSANKLNSCREIYTIENTLRALGVAMEKEKPDEPPEIWTPQQSLF